MGNTGSIAYNLCDEAAEKPYFCYDTLIPSIAIFSFHNFLLFSSEFSEAYLEREEGSKSFFQSFKSLARRLELQT